MNFARIRFRGGNVKRHIRQKVDLVQDQQFGLEENARAFERLVTSLRDAQNYTFRGFAQIVARGADQAADIFDQQQINVFQPASWQAPARSCEHQTSRDHMKSNRENLEPH